MTLRAVADDHAVGAQRDEEAVAEFLAIVHVGHLHLDDESVHGSWPIGTIPCRSPV